MILSGQREDKTKITLSINKQVIDQTREAGIKNISAITESILKALTFSNDKNTKEDVLSAYQGFFKAVQPFLGKYGSSLKVGYIPLSHTENNSAELIIVLYEDSLKTEDQYGTSTEISIKDAYKYLDGLKTILENLFTNLITAAKENKEKIQEFELALRFFSSLKN